MALISAYRIFNNIVIKWFVSSVREKYIKINNIHQVDPSYKPQTVKNEVCLTTFAEFWHHSGFNLFIGKTFTELYLQFNLNIVGVALTEYQRHSTPPMSLMEIWDWDHISFGVPVTRYGGRVG